MKKNKTLLVNLLYKKVNVLFLKGFALFLKHRFLSVDYCYIIFITEFHNLQLSRVMKINKKQ